MNFMSKYVLYLSYYSPGDIEYTVPTYIFIAYYNTTLTYTHTHTYVLYTHEYIYISTYNARIPV